MKKLREVFLHQRMGILLGLLIAGMISLLYLTGVGDLFELRTQDLRFQLRGEKKIDPVIYTVFIGDESIRTLGKWPWRRKYHAVLLHVLGHYRPWCVAYDVLFTEHSEDFPEDDRFLAQATREAGNVYYPFFFGPQDENSESWEVHIERFALGYRITRRDTFIKANGVTLPILELCASMKGTGFVNVIPDKDGVTRKVPLVMQYRDRLYPSLALQIVCDYLGVTRNDINLVPGKYLELKSSHSGKIRIPIDRQGQMWVNYQGGIKSLSSCDFVQILQSHKEAVMGAASALGLSQLKDKIIFVGMSATGSTDLRAIPFSPLYPQVGVLVNAINTILTRNFLQHPSWVINVLSFLGMGIFLGIFFSSVKPIKGTLAALFLISGYVAVSFYLFARRSLCLTIVYPETIIFLTFLSCAVYRHSIEEKEKRRIKNIFQRYVSSQVVEELLANPQMISLGGKKKIVTILFADIRNFTRIASDMTPEKVVNMLNQFFTGITEIIFKYGGTLDKYIGDCVMAIYGAPIEEEKHAEKALRSALDMRNCVQSLAQRFSEIGVEPIRLGIGINTGEAVIGNIGSLRRMEYTAIGDSVNLASRLEEAAKPNQILISDVTYRLVKDIIDARPLEPMAVAGKTELIQAYEVLGLKQV